MEALPLPKGLIVDLITPLTNRGEIDGQSLGKYLDRIIPHAQALFIACPHMGEGRILGAEQREELFERTLDLVQGRTPVMVWISRETAGETLEMLGIFKKRMGVRKYQGQVLWVDTPLYYHSNRGLPQHYKEMSAMIEEPLVLHNDPEVIRTLDKSFKRNNLRTGILKELSGMDFIKGLIFVGSLDRAYNYQKAVMSRAGFRMYDGDESHFLEHPSLSGVVSEGASLAPRAWQKITASSLNQDGNRQDYPDFQKQIWEAGAYLTRLKDIYKAHNVPLFKQVLSDMGIIEDSGNGIDADDMTDERKQLLELMRQYGDHS